MAPKGDNKEDIDILSILMRDHKNGQMSHETCCALL